MLPHLTNSVSIKTTLQCTMYRLNTSQHPTNFFTLPDCNAHLKLSTCMGKPIT